MYLRSGVPLPETRRIANPNCTADPPLFTSELTSSGMPVETLFESTV